MKATKRCSKCKQGKPISEFHKNRTTKDGLQAYCKSCQISDVNKYQKTEKGKTTRKLYSQSKEGKARYKRYRQSENGDSMRKKYAQSERGKTVQKRGDKHFNICHPNHRKAKNAVNHAVKAGRLPRPDTLICHYCPKPAQQYHHWHGYEKEHWLDVVPVCIQCHNNCERRIV